VLRETRVNVGRERERERGRERGRRGKIKAERWDLMASELEGSMFAQRCLVVINLIERVDNQ
jgi:hypothetical protein